MTRRRRASSLTSMDNRENECENVRDNPPKVFDNITRKLIKFGITVSITMFVGLIVRYAVKEFDPSVSTIAVTTLKIDNNSIASLSVSKHFVERILEIIEESISIVSTVLPIGFPLCCFVNKLLAIKRASSKLIVKNKTALVSTIPKYFIIGDSALLKANSSGNEFGGDSSSSVATSLMLSSAAAVATLPKRLTTAAASNNDNFASTTSSTTLSAPTTTLHVLSPGGNLSNASTSIVCIKPLVKDTIYYLLKLNLKPKLILEESLEDARVLAQQLGLLPARNYHKFAIIRSIDLLRNITDSSGDIKVAKVRLLLSKLKVMAQSTPADKSLLIYLIKKCEVLPSDGVIYFGANFTDLDAMLKSDCALAYEKQVNGDTFANNTDEDDEDNDDVRQQAHVLIKQTRPRARNGGGADSSDADDDTSFASAFVLAAVCKLSANVTQSFALYQISAAICACAFRFLSIMIFGEQLITRSEFALLMLMQQIIAVSALMTKWIASLPRQPLSSTSRVNVKRLHVPIVGSPSISLINGNQNQLASTNYGDSKSRSRSRSVNRNSPTAITPHSKRRRRSSSSKHRSNQQANSLSDIDIELGQQRDFDVGAASKQQYKSSYATSGGEEDDDDYNVKHQKQHDGEDDDDDDDDDTEYDEYQVNNTSRDLDLSSNDDFDGLSANRAAMQLSITPTRRQQLSSVIPMSGIDFNVALIDSSLASTYKQTFRRSKLIDDANLKLAKLHVTYQLLVMLIIMAFGNSMFQLNVATSRQHQTLALNCYLMLNLLNLINCFNQFGKLNIKSGIKSHPFFVCILVFAVFFQIALTEFNAFGLQNMNPSQWFFCFVFALLGDLIAPFTGQQNRQRVANSAAPGKRVKRPTDMRPYVIEADIENQGFVEQKRRHSSKQQSFSTTAVNYSSSGNQSPVEKRLPASKRHMSQHSSKRSSSNKQSSKSKY